MTTLTDLRRRVLYLLEDPTGEGYSDELLVDAIVSAMDAILPWVPKTVSTLITGDGLLTSFALPSDFYDVEAVVIEADGLTIPKANFSPGNYHGEFIEGKNDWMLFPNGYITFSKAIESDANYRLYYYAQWNKPDLNTDFSATIEPPDYTVTGLVLYAAAYALLPSSIGTAEVRQYGTRIDSGQPEHNPLQKSITFLQNMFLQEMNRLPKRPRGIT